MPPEAVTAPREHVYQKAVSQQLAPIRYSAIPSLFGSPQILPGEAPSAWIWRLAVRHRRVPNTVLRLWGSHASPDRLDFTDTPPDTWRMAVSTGSPRVTISEALALGKTLLSDPAYACLTNDLVEDGQQVPIYRYCPQCLVEDVQPFIRRTWRLAYSVVCRKHHIVLRDCCPHCMARIDLTHLNSIWREIGMIDRVAAYCPACCGSLTATPGISVPEPCLSVVLNFQERLRQVMISGVFRHHRLGTISARDLLHMYLIPSSVEVKANQTKYIGINWPKVVAPYWELLAALKHGQLAFSSPDPMLYSDQY